MLVEQKNTGKCIPKELGVSPSIISSGIVGVAMVVSLAEVLIMDDMSIENLLSLLFLVFDYKIEIYDL